MIIEINSVLEKLNLNKENKLLDSLPSELSGGQLQRISIARVLLIKPKILICDESVNMLDAPVKYEILDLLRELQEKMDLSIIFITHDLGIASKFCNRILVLDEGEIVERGFSEQIFHMPKHPITQLLLRSSLN